MAIFRQLGSVLPTEHPENAIGERYFAVLRESAILPDGRQIVGIRGRQLAALLLVSCCFLVAQEPATSKKSPYEDMVEKVKAGDASANFRQLWLAYIAFHVRTPRKGTEPQKDEMNQALRDKNYKRALEKAEEVLREDFVDVDAHSAEFTVYQEQAQSDLANRQKHIVEGLRSSMTNLGDGKTVETAFGVNNVHEEYVILRFAGLMPSKQSLVMVNSEAYDFLEAIDPNTSDTFKLYFRMQKGL